jgi:formylglycine-generating enzyme required for sulfatase activity
VDDVPHRELPVDSVSFSDATDFCKLLSSRPAEAQAGRVYRLPTEAEWEYACRAGTTGPFAIAGLGQAGLTANHANIAGRQGRTTPVGSFKPNGLGLFDMHGNVWEWCQDRYGRYSGAAVDPTGPATGAERILRGGSWQNDATLCRSSYREHLEPTKRTSSDGFRVVCEIKKR